MVRKLVTIKKIDAITPIDGADKIECAHIGGWTVVVGKDEFQVGDSVLYFEVDSMLPLEKPIFAFLAPRGKTTYNGEDYHRLKTIKLRGQISQGLILPIADMTDNVLDPNLDLAEYFGVIKYDPPQKFDSAGAKLLPWPDWITKTDEERVQNLDKDVLEAIIREKDNFIPTVKIDGTSITIWAKIDENGVLTSGVCSRNNGIEETEGNAYWDIANIPSISYNADLLSPIDYLQLKCFESVRNMTDPNDTASFVLQGELFGEGIQRNPFKIKGRKVKFFNLFVNGRQIMQDELIKKYPELSRHWVSILPQDLPDTLEEIIKQPDGFKWSLNGKDAVQIEGIVWRHRTKPFLEGTNKIDISKVPEEKRERVLASKRFQPLRASFKVISNKYLLKHDG